MTDIIASPAVKEAVKIVMEQQNDSAKTQPKPSLRPQPTRRAQPSQSAHPYCERHNSRTKRKTMHAIASTLKAR